MVIEPEGRDNKKSALRYLRYPSASHISFVALESEAFVPTLNIRTHALPK